MRPPFKGFRPFLGPPPSPEERPFHGKPPAVIAEQIGFLLGSTAYRSFERLWSALQTLGIEPPHHGILLALERDGPQTQKALTQTLNIDRTTMVHLLDELEAKGLVRRDPDPRDRRAHAVHLTAAGEALLTEANAKSQEAEREFLAPLSPEEQKQLRELLHGLLRAHASPPPE